MPHTVNSIGTSFCGRAEPQIDGSYITTEWLTVLVPLIPFASYRLRPVGNVTSTYNGHSQKYEILQKLNKIYAKQVKRIYKGLVFFLVVTALSIYFLIVDLAINHNNWVGWLICIAIIVISAFIFEYWANRFTR